MSARSVARQIAARLAAIRNCQASDHLADWKDKHTEALEALVKEHMPSGSGFDCGTSFDFDKSTPEKLVFLTAFHHMDEGGAYDGWTHHTVTVRASFVHGLDIRISGRDRNRIKELIYDAFDLGLSAEAYRMTAIA